MKKFLRVTCILTFAFILALSLIACGENDQDDIPSDDVVEDEAPVVEKEYTIQYSDSTGSNTITVKDGQVYRLESIPQKTGHVFKGLFDSKTGGTMFVDENGSSVSAFTDKKNMVLFPQFEPIEYIVQLDYQGASVIGGSRSFKIKYGEIMEELPTGLSLPNKTFKGWYTEKDKKGTQVGDEYGVIASKAKVTEANFDLSDPDNFITLYAGFSGQMYTLTLYVGSNTIPEEIEVEHGTNINTVVTETRVNDKAVISWSTSKNDTQLSNVFTGKVVSDMVLYSAEYAPYIEFNTAGGEDVSTIVLRAGDRLSLPTPKRENYAFQYWKTTGGVRFDNTTMPTTSQKLTAVWQAKIVFNENGGTSVEDISQATGTTLTLPETTKSGYIFAGWYDAANKKYENSSMPESSIVLKARWYKILTKQVVLITATDTYGGSSCNTSPSMDKSMHEIDVSDLVGLNVNIKISYKSSIDGTWGDVGVSDPKYSYMAWYNERTASDMYKVWSYKEEHVEDNKFETYDRSTSLKITTSKLYVCRYGCTNSYYYIYRWTNFYVEIEYPDTSILY